MARNTLIQVRRDTAANWTSANPTLAAGEIGLETDTGKFKIGDGSTAWNTANYVNYLAKLKDVTITDLQSGQQLQWNGSAWVNVTPSGGHTQNTDTGTTSSTFQIDNDATGPKLKNDSGELQVRNAADDAYADLRVKNLVVEGTTTTIHAETLTIDDNIIVLNNNVTGTPTEDGGIEIERGTSTNAVLIWDEDTDTWMAGISGSEKAVLLAGDAIPAPGSPEQGDVLYYNGSAWTALNHGTAHQVFKSGGHGANPAWGDVDGGSA